ncbi:MAG TPA: hypothetical protein VHZ03_17120 [Trebonia sp.]|nr:hypothetical protein [Trebonia sp.]
MFPPGCGCSKARTDWSPRACTQAAVCLGDAITGIDERNLSILVSAVLHAGGRRQFPSHLTRIATTCTCLA